jgi:glycosyltransferase involved in cell wall biosynthesis
MYKKNDTLIIIPAFNEAWNIESLIYDLRATVPACDILVVNDASTDLTGSLAEKTGEAAVLNFPYNLGIGAAVQAGFKYARKHGYDYALQFDGDGQHKSTEIDRLLKLLRLNHADVVVGSRFCKKRSEGYRSTFMRRIGIRIFKFVTLLLIQKRINDCTSGFRAYNKEAIRFLSWYYPADYPEPEALIMLGKNGFRISEIYTPMNERAGGKSSITSRSVFYMAKVLLAMVMTAMRPKIS